MKRLLNQMHLMSTQTIIELASLRVEFLNQCQAFDLTSWFRLIARF